MVGLIDILKWAMLVFVAAVIAHLAKVLMDAFLCKLAKKKEEKRESSKVEESRKEQAKLEKKRLKAEEKLEKKRLKNEAKLD